MPEGDGISADICSFTTDPCRGLALLELETFKDIENLVLGNAAESLTLEFKSSPALSKSNECRSELVKDVTAFANSAGGQIIYGIVEKEGVANYIDDGVETSTINADWISQVLDTNCSPRVQGIIISMIRNEKGGGPLFSITIPAATVFAPHQNSIDKKYYRRFESRAVPMADYEIRDLLKRSQVPHLKLTLSFVNGERSISHPKRQFPFVVIPTVENLSSEPSLYNLFELSFDKQLYVESGSWKDLNKTTDFGSRKMVSYQKSFMVPNQFPLIKGTNITFGPPDITLRLPYEPKGEEEEKDIYWISYYAVACGFNISCFCFLIYQENILSLKEFFEVGT